MNPVKRSHRNSSNRTLVCFAFLLLAAISASPALGRERVSVNVSLPIGAARVTVGGHNYYEHRGVFYQKRGEKFIITRAPRGAHLRTLPRHHTKVIVRGRTYYRVQDAYYVRENDRYVVVDAPETPPAPIIADLGQTPTTVRVWLGEREYQIDQGEFFRATPAGLIWEETPYGATITDLPTESVTKWYRDTEYFDYQGVIFRRSPDGFKVVPAPWVD